MTKLLGSLALAAITVSALALALPVAATAAPAPMPAATVAASGNFHTTDNAVACHWITYKPVSVGLAASVKVHCERFSDKTFVTLQTNGTVTTSHSGTAVAKGNSHPLGWFHRYTVRSSYIVKSQRQAGLLAQDRYDLRAFAACQDLVPVHDDPPPGVGQRQ